VVSRAMVVATSARLGNRASSGLVGDNYEGVWYAAPWWYQYHPDWVSEHHPIGGRFRRINIIGARRMVVAVSRRLVPANHPDWWGDYDDQRIWRPAGWWWQKPSRLGA